jgi:integrase
MGRAFNKDVRLPDGRRVGYGLIRRKVGAKATFHVSFLNAEGQRVRRALGTGKVGEVQGRAEEVIAREYRTLLPRQQVTWDEAAELLKKKFAASGRRPTTLAQYLKDMDMIRRTFPDTTGPADITEVRAERWMDDYATGLDRRIRAKGKERRQHSAHNVKARLGSLSALWNKWFHGKLGLVPANPFARLEPPKADRPEVRYVTDEQMTEFFGYLSSYYGDWPFPALFFSVKAYTGSRLADLCGLKSVQVRDGAIVFPAAAVKGRKERSVPLPPSLFESLRRYAGPTHLWEKYPAELKAILAAKGVPTHQLMTEFHPARLYMWVLNLFKEYRGTGPKTGPITSHQFRKRAFTLAWKGDVRVQEAAIAFGCNPDTLLKHYVRLDEQETTNAVFARIGANILGPAGGTQSAHNSAAAGSETPGETQG